MTRRRFVTVVAAVIAVVLAGGAVAAVVTLGGFERVGHDLDAAREQLGVAPEAEPAPPAAWPGGPGHRLPVPDDDTATTGDGDVEVYLVVGSDGRPGHASARADVILLGFLPPSRSETPAIVSLPRDLWVDDLCRGGRQRINVALSGCGSRASGQELMILTVEEFTGVSVDHYVEVDFDGFTKVVDAVGGVEICTDRPVRDEHLSLPGGCVQADGRDTLEWVRSRHTQEKVDGVWRTKPGVDDLTRNERQQDVLLQVFERATSRWSLPQLHAMAVGLADTVWLDDDLGIGHLVRTAWRWRDTGADDVTRVELDLEPHTTGAGAEVLLLRTDFEEALTSAGVELHLSE